MRLVPLALVSSMVLFPSVFFFIYLPLQFHLQQHLTNIFMLSPELSRINILVTPYKMSASFTDFWGISHK